ncbi:MAG: phage major capsid protein [Candidatus Margulisbacteria bacterium]|nr:phage major capsid protein [Candidatus Margulisiibacteriota bacterium]
MTAEELKTLHEGYRRCIETMRDESASPEARQQATDEVMEFRHKIDSGLIEKEQAREDDERMQALEARQAAARKVAAVSSGEPRKNDIDWDAIRGDVLAGKGCKRSYSLSLFTPPEARTEYDVSTAASNAYGSYLVPQTWASTITTAMVAQSGVLQAGPSIVRTSQGGQMNFPTLATDIAAASITEGSAATQDTPVFGTVPLNAYDVGGYLIITEDLIQDSGPDVSNYLAQLAGRAIAQKVAAYLGDEDIGTGSGAPAAITVGATSAVTAAAVDSASLDELIQVYGAVIPPYRVNGKWIVNNDIFVEMLTAKGGDGQYLTHPSLTAAVPDMFLGKPLIEDQYFDASATGNKVAGFGDVAAAYVVRYVGPVQIDFSADAGFTSFEVYLRYKIRFDAATLIASAFQIVTLG